MTTIAWTALAAACPVVLSITFWLRREVLLGHHSKERVESEGEDEAAVETGPEAEGEPVHRVPAPVRDEEL